MRSPRSVHEDERRDGLSSARVDISGPQPASVRRMRDVQGDEVLVLLGGSDGPGEPVWHLHEVRTRGARASKSRGRMKDPNSSQKAALEEALRRASQARDEANA